MLLSPFKNNLKIKFIKTLLAWESMLTFYLSSLMSLGNYKNPHNYYPRQDIAHFYHPRKLPFALIPLGISLSAPHTTIYMISVLEIHIMEFYKIYSFESVFFHSV